jgi:hypothetical protein
MAKCAEYGLDGQQLLKEAISRRDYNTMYSRLAKEYGNDASDYGYSQYLGKMPARRGFFGRMFRGKQSTMDDLKAQFEQRRQLALDKHDDAVSRMPQNMRTAYLEALKERTDQALTRRAFQGMDPAMRKMVEDKMKPQQAAGGASGPVQSDRYGAGMRDAVMSGRLAVPSYANHSINQQTGELYRTDGRELHPGAAQWNMRLNYNGPAVAQGKPVTATPAPAAPAK